MRTINKLSPEDLSMFQGQTAFIEDEFDLDDIDVPESDKNYEGFLPEWL